MYMDESGREKTVKSNNLSQNGSCLIGCQFQPIYSFLVVLLAFFLFEFTNLRTKDLGNNKMKTKPNKKFSLKRKREILYFCEE